MIAARSTASTLKFVVVVVVVIGVFTRCAPLCCFKFIHTLDSIIQSSSCMYIRMKKLECLSLMFSTMCTPSSYDSNLLEHISVLATFTKSLTFHIYDSRMNIIHKL